jgi:hypothetical protein
MEKGKGVMAESKTPLKKTKGKDVEELFFDVSTGLKRVLGRELITNDEVAIFEMVKNSFDADADTVHLHFEEDSVIVVDNGSGMSYEDLNNKWLFVAYSSKRDQTAEKDFRNRAADRSHFAGSKGIGRFSSDRLGEELILQTRPKSAKGGPVHRLKIDWDLFEKNDKEHFEKVPVEYSEASAFQLPDELRKFGATLRNGTVIQIRKLRRDWDRSGLLGLRAALAKLINPFGENVDGFSIHVSAPAELAQDKENKSRAAKAGVEVLSKDIVNG